MEQPKRPGLAGDSERAKIIGAIGGRKPKGGKLSLHRQEKVSKARQALKDLHRKREEEQ